MAQDNLGRDLKLRLIDNRALSIYAVEDTTRRKRGGGRAVRINDFAAIQEMNISQKKPIVLKF